MPKSPYTEKKKDYPTQNPIMDALSKHKFGGKSPMVERLIEQEKVTDYGVIDQDIIKKKKK